MKEIIQALLIGIIYLIPTSRFGYSFSHIAKLPLVVALPIGIVLGDVPQAIKIGATLSMLYMGLIPAGSNIPADECLAACIAIPVALKTNMSPEVAVTLALPVGILGVFFDQIRRTANAFFVHLADKYAEEANTSGIRKAATLYPFILQIFLRVIPVFIATLYGGEAIGAFMDSIPEWLVHGLEVAGGVLPGLGFALTIMVIGKKKLIPYFIIGFFLVQYAQIPTMAAAIFGACIAFLHIQFETSKGDNQGGVSL